MTNATRPQPPPDPVYEEAPPGGYRYVWVAATSWRVADAQEHEGRKCRRPGCQRPPVAALLRSRGWWLYCDWHLYGKRIVNGEVLNRILEPLR